MCEPCADGRHDSCDALNDIGDCDCYDQTWRWHEDLLHTSRLGALTLPVAVVLTVAAIVADSAWFMWAGVIWLAGFAAHDLYLEWRDDRAQQHADRLVERERVA